jgi:ferritin-like metal-binding protein YciE
LHAQAAAVCLLPHVCAPTDAALPSQRAAPAEQESVMTISTTNEKFLHELGDIYDAEHRFLEAHQEMLSQVNETSLREGLEKHIEQTQQQIEVLEQVYQALGQQPEREGCEAAKGILLEAQQNLQNAGTDHIRDCFICASSLKIEHYEISAYRGLVVTAQQIGYEDIELLLQGNLKQEEETAQKLEVDSPMLVKLALQQEKMEDHA